MLRSEDGSSIAATAFFIGAAFTDFLDGQFARHTGTVSALGQRLDPLADRLLISGVLIALAIAGTLPVAAVILVALRDFFMIIGYKVLQRRGVILRVSYLGKTYTALFMVAIVISMAGFDPGGLNIGVWLFWISVAGSLLSGIIYTVKGFRSLAEPRGARA